MIEERVKWEGDHEGSESRGEREIEKREERSQILRRMRLKPQIFEIS